MSILDLFCSMDELWQQFAPWWHRQLQVRLDMGCVVASHGSITLGHDAV